MPRCTCPKSTVNSSPSPAVEPSCRVCHTCNVQHAAVLCFQGCVARWGLVLNIRRREVAPTKSRKHHGVGAILPMQWKLLSSMHGLPNTVACGCVQPRTTTNTHTQAMLISHLPSFPKTCLIQTFNMHVSHVSVMLNTLHVMWLAYGNSGTCPPDILNMEWQGCLAL